jgi:hypothetical protein
MLAGTILPNVFGSALAWRSSCPLDSRHCPSPELTASPPGGSRTKRDMIDISDEQGRRKWLNSHALHYQSLVT